jgi:hypothetical protein
LNFSAFFFDDAAVVEPVVVDDWGSDVRKADIGIIFRLAGGCATLPSSSLALSAFFFFVALPVGLPGCLPFFCCSLALLPLAGSGSNEKDVLDVDANGA